MSSCGAVTHCSFLKLCRFAQLVITKPIGTRRVFPFALVLLLAFAARATGPVGPFVPSLQTGSADSDPGRCTQQKGLVYLSTYLSGWQLNEQGFDAPMGNVYYQGPKLTRSSLDTEGFARGEWCQKMVSRRRHCATC